MCMLAVTGMEAVAVAGDEVMVVADDEAAVAAGGNNLGFRAMKDKAEGLCILWAPARGSDGERKTACEYPVVALSST